MKWISIKDKLPPIKFGVGILVTDGKIITVTEITKPMIPEDPFTMNGYGFGGYEWEFDIDEKDITHWMPLPKLPGETHEEFV